MSKFKKETWRRYSEYRRKLAKDWKDEVVCYTCGAVKHYKEVHLGHYVHNRLDFDDRNTKIQCVKCNMYLSGRLDQYTLNLIRDYGLPWVEQLRNDAHKHKGYTRAELAGIREWIKRLSVSNLK